MELTFLEIVVLSFITFLIIGLIAWYDKYLEKKPPEWFCHRQGHVLGESNVCLFCSEEVGEIEAEANRSYFDKEYRRLGIR